jgi:nucleotide-binding universal stress UspA family protein
MAFHKILCPVDFSPGSQCAMRAAVRLANEHDGELVLVHSWFVPTLYAGEILLSGEVVQQISDDAERALAGALAEAVALGARRVTSKLVSGVPWQQIVDTALSDSFDLIVIGTHGRTGIARVLLGSIAELVVRHAPCPVLAIRPGPEPEAFRHVLCPVDFSESSRDATRLAASLVQPGGAGITLLHVIELPVSYAGELRSFELSSDLDERSAARLDEWVKELAAKVAVPVTRQSRIGGAGAQTLAAVDADSTIDLVVMGSHGRTGASRLLLGSVAEKVVRHARCPVLVARRAP